MQILIVIPGLNLVAMEFHIFEFIFKPGILPLFPVSLHLQIVSAWNAHIKLCFCPGGMLAVNCKINGVVNIMYIVLSGYYNK